MVHNFSPLLDRISLNIPSCLLKCSCVLNIFMFYCVCVLLYLFLFFYFFFYFVFYTSEFSLVLMAKDILYIQIFGLLFLLLLWFLFGLLSFSNVATWMKYCCVLITNVVCNYLVETWKTFKQHYVTSWGFHTLQIGTLFRTEQF